jgi:hypothetical protein
LIFSFCSRHAGKYAEIYRYLLMWNLQPHYGKHP